MITPRSYKESLSRTEKSVSDKVQAYLKEPSEDNVHNLRTSIRRFLTAANILPKKIRGEKESRNQLKNYEKLLKLNTETRDIDIILSKLPHHGDDPAFAKLAKQLSKARESSLKRASRLATQIGSKKSSPITAYDLSSSTIHKRFKKTAGALSESLREHLRVVAKDPKNTTELHKLREDSRRLRFTLEIDDTPETGKVLPALEKWQDALGKIRDSDIFISHFKNDHVSGKIKEVLEQEKSGRRENYEKFLEIAKESPQFY